MIKYRVEIDNEKTVFWYKWETNELHREDGPAMEWVDGDKEWYLNDKHLTEDEWKKRVSIDNHEGKVVEIDGVEYELRKPK